MTPLQLSRFAIVGRLELCFTGGYLERFARFMPSITICSVAAPMPTANTNFNWNWLKNTTNPEFSKVLLKTGFTHRKHKWRVFDELRNEIYPETLKEFYQNFKHDPQFTLIWIANELFASSDLVVTKTANIMKYANFRPNLFATDLLFARNLKKNSTNLSSFISNLTLFFAVCRVFMPRAKLTYSFSFSTSLCNMSNKTMVIFRN